ncbi:uncharacterized protein N7487_000596 [Penicillium crustosum]|uniref:uncharacterized protein n=1 Tax=Penicillium crustosum TaxID=36656 RepID=UPI0023A2C56E|nr:uncharacterized protein N7487_000596 [Penicillium crustosum]KAJ5417046.1 hypothetical protein N7487_000596 [Penicillium crustosum]
MANHSTRQNVGMLGYDPFECGDLDGFRESGLSSFRPHHALKLRMKPIIDAIPETFDSLGILAGCPCGVQRATIAQRTPLHVLMQIAQCLAHIAAASNCPACMCAGISMMYLAWLRASECEERRGWSDSIIGCCECVGLSQFKLHDISEVIQQEPASVCQADCWAKALSDAGELSVGEALYVNRARVFTHPSGTTSFRNWLTKITEPYADQLFGSCDQMPFREALGLTGWYTVCCSHPLAQGAEETLREIIRYTMDAEMFSQYDFKSQRQIHSRSASLPDVDSSSSDRADKARPILREKSAVHATYVTRRLVDGIWTPFFYQRMSKPMISYHRSQIQQPTPIECLSVLVFDTFTHRRRLQEDGNIDSTSYVNSLNGQSASGAYSKWHAYICSLAHQAALSSLWDITHHLPPLNIDGDIPSSDSGRELPGKQE